MKKILLFKALVIGIILLFFGASVVSSINSDVEIEISNTANADWWNHNWEYRKQITIDHSMVDDDLNDFPVLIYHESMDLANNAQSDGDDIVFVNQDNVKLDHEIELYDDNDGELVAWVCMPSLSSSTDTVLYMYYGNPDCGNQQDPEDVWDSNYIHVWHMDGLSTVYDSTGNDAGTNYGTDSVTGKIGDARDFVSSQSDYIDWGDMDQPCDNVLDVATFECWIKPDSITDDQRIANKYKTSGTKYQSYIIGVLEGKPRMSVIHSYENSFKYKTDNVETPSGTWSHLAFAVTIGTTRNIDIYVNGSEKASTKTSMGTQPTVFYNRPISDETGRTRYLEGTQYSDMIIDEIRWSKVVRSSEWISTSYNNQNDSESFIDFGEQKTRYQPVADFTYSKIGGLSVLFNGSSSYDPDGTIISYEWEFGDGNNGVGMFVNHIYSDSGAYDVTLTVTDNDSHTDDITKNIEVINQPPGKPLINGPPTGNVGNTYSYTILSEDPNDDDVYYYVDWGDGSVENWIGPYPSNEVKIVSHSWSEQGNFTIMARAKDIYGEIGEWATLEVSMPKNKPFNINPLFLRFLEQRPNLFPLLRTMLGL